MFINSKPVDTAICTDLASQLIGEPQTSAHYISAKERAYMQELQEFEFNLLEENKNSVHENN